MVCLSKQFEQAHQEGLAYYRSNRDVRDSTGAKGREFCVVHPDGRTADAELHESILDQPEVEAAAREIGKVVARRARLTEDEVKTLYADD
jgi:hypothetical protein